MEKPKLLVVAGPNGSGKTTFTRQLLKDHWSEDCEFINPDDIAKEKFGDWNSPEAVIKAANLAAQYRLRCLAEKRSMVLETVLSREDKIDFIRQAREGGFFVRIFFIGRCYSQALCSPQRPSLGPGDPQGDRGFLTTYSAGFECTAE